jgi:hypothetical protein
MITLIESIIFLSIAYRLYSFKVNFNQQKGAVSSLNYSTEIRRQSGSIFC